MSCRCGSAGCSGDDTFPRADLQRFYNVQRKRSAGRCGVCADFDEVCRCAQEKDVTLPFGIQKKQFVSERIPLDARNTWIRKDTSPERRAQIEKLNNILATVMPQDVYTLKPFALPVDLKRITSSFGNRRVFVYADKKTSTSMHYGIDYGVPTGTPVKACAEGKVVLAENRISTGWSVVIEHLPGLCSLYYHLDSFGVNEGQYVKQGEQIGVSGATGLATGSHLHWEVRLNMEAVNPEFLFESVCVLTLMSCHASSENLCTFLSV